MEDLRVFFKIIAATISHHKGIVALAVLMLAFIILVTFLADMAPSAFRTNIRSGRASWSLATAGLLIVLWGAIATYQFLKRKR